MNVVPIISNTFAYYLVLCSTSLHITVTCQIYIIPMVKQHLLVCTTVLYFTGCISIKFLRLKNSYVLR